MKRFMSLLMIGFMIFTLSACGANTDTKKDNNSKSKQSATTFTNTSDISTDNSDSSIGILSNFSTKDLDGNDVTQSILSDSKLTMINVWATFCGPCLNEMPDLGELATEYKDVRIIGLVSDVLNSDGSLSDSQISTAKEIVSSTKAKYLHIVPSNDLYGILSQINSVPTTFFVNSNGKQVGEVYIGAKSKSEWSTIIKDTLEEISE